MCNCSVHVSTAFIPLSPCTHNAYLAYDLISSVWPCSPRVKLSPSASNLMMWEWNVRVGYHCALVLRLAFGKSHPITWTLQMVISDRFPEAATKKENKKMHYCFHRSLRTDSHSVLKFDLLESLEHPSPDHKRRSSLPKALSSVLFLPKLLPPGHCGKSTTVASGWHICSQRQPMLRGVNLQHSYHFTSSSNNRSDITIELKTKG